MNGESHADVDRDKFVAVRLDDEAGGALVVVRADERRDTGSILLDDDGNVVPFAEKQMFVLEAALEEIQDSVNSRKCVDMGTPGSGEACRE